MSEMPTVGAEEPAANSTNDSKDIYLPLPYYDDNIKKIDSS